jgi:hypothetical protein
MTRSVAARAACIVVAALACSGCGTRSGPLRLTSYHDPYFPETYPLKLDQAVYYQDRSGDMHLAGHLLRPSDANTAALEQWLHVHVFWRPRPGKTRDNPTSLDATIRFVQQTRTGPVSYIGSAFAYPDVGRDGRTKFSIESSRLKCSDASNDPLGECKIVGDVTARENQNVAVDLMRQIDRLGAPRE